MIESYGTDPLQSLKVFNYSEDNKVSVVFIHGGAWRDPNNTFDDFKDFADYAQRQYPLVNTFGLNYRLSPSVKHPAHLQDIVEGVKYLLKTYNVNSVNYVGHSVGATLILQMLRELDQESGQDPKQEESGVVIKNCYLLDGIFDIPELLSEYPSYSSFVEEAFTSKKLYTEATAIYGTQFTGINRLSIIQSLDDELLSENQSDKLAEYLENTATNFSIQKGHWGLHEEVYRNKEVFDLVLGTLE